MSGANRTRTRPTVWQWIGYAFGRTLDDDLRDWVRRDLLGRNFYIRHLVRGMVPFLPIFAVFMMFPGPWWLRAQMVALAAVLGLIYCAAYMDQNRRHRLGKHGIDPDLLPESRRRQAVADRAAYEAIYGRSTSVTRRSLDPGGRERLDR